MGTYVDFVAILVQNRQSTSPPPQKRLRTARQNSHGLVPRRDDTNVGWPRSHQSGIDDSPSDWRRMTAPRSEISILLGCANVMAGELLKGALNRQVRFRVGPIATTVQEVLSVVK